MSHILGATTCPSCSHPIMPSDMACQHCRIPLNAAASSPLRAEADRLTAYEIERHEQAARQCDAEGNEQQARWHRNKVRQLEAQRRQGGAKIDRAGRDETR